MLLLKDVLPNSALSHYVEAGGSMYTQPRQGRYVPSCRMPLMPLDQCALRLQTLPFEELLDCRLAGRAPDIVAAGVLLLRERISKLARLVGTGQVAIEVCLGWKGGGGGGKKQYCHQPASRLRLITCPC